MVKLQPSESAFVYELYKTQTTFFPIIAGVIRGIQDGVIYCNRLKSPSAFYVEHCFGFAQIFGSTDDHFLEGLREYLVIKKSFEGNKVRLYTPKEPKFLRNPIFDNIRAERQRFVIKDFDLRIPVALPSIKLRALRRKDIPFLNPELTDVSRFWRSIEDFTANSFAVVAWQESKSLAICYSAATISGKAEIDVATSENCRRRGIGKAVVTAFIDKCRAEKIIPLWDCFTNNLGSMSLAKSCGFVPSGCPYPFYTFSR